MKNLLNELKNIMLTSAVGKALGYYVITIVAAEKEKCFGVSLVGKTIALPGREQPAAGPLRSIIRATHSSW